MLIRCETCQKLYPDHHGACRNCLSGGPVSSTPKKKLSLKDRLNASGPPLAPKNALKSRVHNKSREEPAAPTPEESPPPPMIEQEPEVKLERAAIPSIMEHSEDIPTHSWTSEEGGLCAKCEMYNPPSQVFCCACETMLVRTKVKVEIVTSYPLTDMHGLVNAFTEKLKKQKVTTTEDMLRVGLSRQNRQSLVKSTGMSERSLLRLVHLSDICRVPSITPEHVAMLEMIGINTLQELTPLKSSTIMSKLQQKRMQINNQGIMFFPTKNKVKAWLIESRELEPLKIQP